MKTAFVSPFGRGSGFERAYRETGTHPVEHFVPSFLFDTVEALHEHYHRLASASGRMYEPVVVAEVEVLDLAEFPRPHGGNADVVPIRVLRLVE